MIGSHNQEHTVYFARENFRSNGRIFGIRQKDRRQHMYVIGKSGTGKTTLIKNLALQDINNNKGVAIIDPHGEFVQEILESIPQHRVKDVVYFNPADTDHPIGFNILEVKDVRQKHLVASNLMGIFTKIWAGVWSARMEYILQNCVLALLDTPGTTLLGIPRILVDADYRRTIVENIQDPVVKSFWNVEYAGYTDRLRSEAIVPIQNKVGQFLSTPLIRNLVGQPKSTIDISQIMNDEKILLVNVSKGLVGEDNSALLGAMIITKIQLAAMERIRILEEDRKDFYLYVDEFQNFATDSFASILSEARKYRLNLTIAHQYIGQLVTDTSTKVRDAVFGNVGTIIVFRVGAQDAEYLEPEFTPEFEIEDMVGLPNHNIYLKLLVNGVTSRPFSAATLPPIRVNSSPENIQNIVETTRKNFTLTREEVESEINSWASGLPGTAGKAKEEFPAVCSNCGMQTTAPFKPDGKRPIYCPKCYKKVQNGEIQPLPNMPDPAKKNSFGSSLGVLGIEFDETKSGAVAAAPRPAQHADRRDQRPRQGSHDKNGGQRRDNERKANERPPRRAEEQLPARDTKPAVKAPQGEHLTSLREALKEALKLARAKPSDSPREEKPADTPLEAPIGSPATTHHAASSKGTAFEPGRPIKIN